MYLLGQANFFLATDAALARGREDAHYFAQLLRIPLREARSGLGRIVAKHYCSSTSHRNREHIWYLCF